MEEFNLFKNLNLYEDHHTLFLKKLLSVSSKHNKEDYFLKSFLREVVQVKEEIINNTIASEWKVDDQVKAGKGNSDLVISTNNDVVVFIENKIKGAGDQDNQLYRYWRNVIFDRLYKGQKWDNQKIDEDKFKIAYLTLFAKDKIDENTLKRPDSTDGKYAGFPDKLPMPIITISYQNEVCKWLSNCLSDFKIWEDNNSDKRLKIVIEQYVEWIEKYAK